VSGDLGAAGAGIAAPGGNGRRGGGARAGSLYPNSLSFAASEIASTAGCFRRRSTEIA
jgi:hypothetical protein